MRQFLFSRCLFGVAAFLVVLRTGSADAAEVKIILGSDSRGFLVPPDFAGLSFELSHLLPDAGGQHFFSPENKGLLGLFKTIGIRNLRVGGGTAEDRTNRIPAPNLADIDSLFLFARAADVRVIYTLRLFNGNLPRNVELARYIVERYRSQLSYFSLGNEPDWKSYHTRSGYTPPPGIFLDTDIVETSPGVPGTAYPSFLAKWRRFAEAIVAAAPPARFGGPDTGSNFPLPGALDTDFAGHSWSQHFAQDEKPSGYLVEVDHHDYVGESATGVEPRQAIDDMLSRVWVASRYPALYDHVFRPIIEAGVRYRMTECNDYTGGVDGASNTFVSALWALDYMHWQAEHGATGVNFHNKRWLFTDTIRPDAKGQMGFNPKAYAIAAFNLGAKGTTEVANVVNPADVNLTAYAIRGATGHFLTVINKEHGVGARSATVRVSVPPEFGKAEVVFLTAAGGNLSAREGITLGGAVLQADRPRQEHWESITSLSGQGWRLDILPSSAAIVRFTRL